MQNNRFLRKNVKSGHISISWQPNNRYFKLFLIPVIDNYFIFLTIKIPSPPLRKGKPFLIHTCLFKNHHKWYLSIFDRRTPWIKFIIQPLDVHVCSTSEKLPCDIFRLWHSLPFKPLQYGSKVCLQILVLYHRHDWWILLSLLYLFDKGHTEIFSQCFLNILIVDVNGQNIVTRICVTWYMWSSILIYFRWPSIFPVSHQKIGIWWDLCKYFFKESIKIYGVHRPCPFLMVKHQVEEVISIIWVLYYTIQSLMKTKSRILLLIKSKVTAKYRNCLWTAPQFTSQYLHRYLSYVIHAVSQIDIGNLEVFSWYVVQKIFC